MAKPATTEPVGMERADLKRLLRIASQEPVHAAFAIGGDGLPIIMLDKRKQPQALLKGIKDQAPDAKSHRFGSVSVDPDEPTLARFVVNKAASGMAKKLVIALKGTGFKKVQIMLDDGTPMESAEGEADADDQDGTAQPDAKTAADAGPDLAPQQQPEADGGPQATAPADPAAAPDAAALGQTLTGLVKRMLAAIAQDPSQKAALVELATDAQASLKRGDLQQAAAGVQLLTQAIDQAGNGSASGAAPTADTTAPATPDVTPAPATDSAGPQQQAQPTAAASDASVGDNAPAAPDVAGLTAALTTLVKQLMPIIAADPTQRDTLKGIVAQAQAGLKNGDLDAVSGHVDTLRDMLEMAGQPSAPAQAPSSEPAAATAAPPAANPAAATFAKSRLVWLAARNKVDGDVGKLHDEMMGVFKDHGQAGDISTAFRKRVGSVMDQLDENLAHKLDEIAKNTDQAQHAKLVGEAKQHLQRYESYLANEPLIATLDSNPFTPLNIHKTMTATLSALGKALG